LIPSFHTRRRQGQQINALKLKLIEITANLNIEFLPWRDISVTMISRLMPFRRKNAIYSQTHIKSNMFGQNVELLNVKAGGAYSYH
jgi:hypothetical protein